MPRFATPHSPKCIAPFSLFHFFRYLVNFSPRRMWNYTFPISLLLEFLGLQVRILLKHLTIFQSNVDLFTLSRSHVHKLIGPQQLTFLCYTFSIPIHHFSPSYLTFSVHHNITSPLPITFIIPSTSTATRISIMSLLMHNTSIKGRNKSKSHVSR
jgi:hypothetical protein